MYRCIGCCQTGAEHVANLLWMDLPLLCVPAKHAMLVHPTSVIFEVLQFVNVTGSWVYSV